MPPPVLSKLRPDYRPSGASKIRLIYNLIVFNSAMLPSSLTLVRSTEGATNGYSFPHGYRSSGCYSAIIRRKLLALLLAANWLQLGYEPATAGYSNGYAGSVLLEHHNIPGGAAPGPRSSTVQSDRPQPAALPEEFCPAGIDTACAYLYKRDRFTLV
jgi:hypothetical protein